MGTASCPDNRAGINNPAYKEVLILDSNPASRTALNSGLQQLGYRARQFTNVDRALTEFRRARPDTVITDDCQLAHQIREIDPGQFVPVVFLTSMHNEDALDSCLSSCMDAGIDGFLHRPIDMLSLRATLIAIDRIRSLQARFSSLYRRMKKDEETAESVFSGAVLAPNVAMHQIRTLLNSADVFSGDVLLSAYTPAGDLNVILGDFTGHGLAAAIGALPASEVFRAMTNKGFSPQQILAGINRKLHRLLPTSMFFAVQFVSVSNSLKHVTVCNCGMPDVLLVDGKRNAIKHRFLSRCLPLSILPDIDFQEATEHFVIKPGDQILLMSDGVLEARNPDQDYFGQSRLDRALRETADPTRLLDGISESLARFRQDAPQDDDISLALIPCIPSVFNRHPERDRSLDSDPDPTLTEHLAVQDTTEFSLTLSGSRLRESDPIPLIISHLQEIAGLGRQRRVLYTVLTELYVNALDHGVLGLSSEKKQDAGGFAGYLKEREKRLLALKDGFIKLRIFTRPRPGGGSVEVSVEDSGDGFNFQEWDHVSHKLDKNILSGRGIHLVRELCESVSYLAPGNQVKAVFSWTD